MRISLSLTVGRPVLLLFTKLISLVTFVYRRVLREVLNAREKERRQEVTPPVARTRQARSEVTDDDEGDDEDDANRVGAGATA